MGNMLQETLQEKAFNNIQTKRKPNETPKNLFDTFNSLQGFFTKGNDFSKECVFDTLVALFPLVKDYIQKTKPLLILQQILLWLSKTSSKNLDCFKMRKLLSQLFVEYIKLLDTNLKIKLKEIILSNLEKIMEKKKQKEHQANESQLIVILTGLNALILQLGI